jgi:N-acetylglutamate synthase-like GNAT family acetyltransferase
MDGEDKRRMNSLSFVTTSNSEWNKRMTSDLRKECEALTGRIKDFQIHNLYAKSGETFAGGTSIEQHGDILWIDSIWVEPHFRKQGIGKMLIEKIMHFEVEGKAKEVQLNTYFKEAHGFFLVCGFEDVATIPNWKYGLTCYLMRKRV